MSGLLRPLLDAIETVRDRINLARARAGWSEAQTRASLIDPVLIALGWDTGDPKSVALELNIKGKSADYALLGDDGTPVVIVEAKRIGTNLDHMDQLAQVGMYGLGGGAHLVTLTDGDQWHLYDLKRVQSDGGVVFRERLSTGQPEAMAVRFLELWQPYVRARHASQPAQRETEAEGATPDGPAPDSAPKPAERDWIPLDEIPAGPEPPASIRFPDKTTVSLSDWPDLQVQIVLWLHRKSDLEKAPIPFRHTRKGKTSIRQQTDSDWQWRSVPETNLEVSTVGTSQTVLDRMQRLLRSCGHEPSSVLAKFLG